MNRSEIKAPTLPSLHGRVVYFLWDHEVGEIKIGFSKELNRRVAAIRRDRDGRDLVVLATRPGGRRTEREEHSRWASYRKKGEWFAATPAVVSYVASLPGAHRTRCERATRLAKEPHDA